MSGPPFRAKKRHFLRQFKRMLWTLLRPHQVLPSSSDGRPSMEWRLCRAAQYFCLPVHNVFPRSFAHDFPRHKTKRLFSGAIFPNQVTFSVAPAEIRDSNIFFVFFKNILVRFAFTLSAYRAYMVKK